MKELPYVFDLLYDIKTEEQAIKIAQGFPDCSSARVSEIIELYEQENIPLPPELRNFK